MPKADESQRYKEHKDREATRSRNKSQAGREIGELPPIVDKSRREACEFNLRLFCETYLAEQFTLAWSKNHLLAIGKIERAILKGGLFALAMPRGSGKTTLAEAAALWAILYGHKHFVVIIGAESEHAEEIADSLRTELETNEKLYEDFPEACYPIAALDGIVNRAAGQLFQGERTRMRWTGKLLRLANIPDAPCSGAVIKTAGITGRIRGMRFKLPDGSTVRPDLVIPDDPQTDESAASIEQNKKRLKTLAKAVLGLAGPGKKISGVMPCTVIEPGDCIDQILDQTKYPQWQGQRTKLIEKWPESPKWATYCEIWKQGVREGRGIAEATEFYFENYEEMRAGAEVNWEARYDPEELDAIQHCWNLKLLIGEKEFEAEYNNNPQHDDDRKLLDFTMLARVGAFAQWALPHWAIKNTAFIDVQGEALFYVCASWQQDFTGHVHEYEIWPKQRAGLVRLSELTDLLSDHPGQQTSRIYEGLKNLIAYLRSRVGYDAIGIDANWGISTDTVYKIAYELAGANVHACHGRFYGASSQPLNSGKPKIGEQRGYYWKRIIEGPRTRIIFDANSWKDTLLSGLMTPIADPGALTVYSGSVDDHTLLDEHAHSEFFVETWARGNKKNEWKQTPGVDNHWWDGMVGASMLASFCGCSVPSWGSGRATPVSFKEMQERARRGG